MVKEEISLELPLLSQTSHEKISNSFKSDNQKGKNVSGQVNGGIVVQGNYHACPQGTWKGMCGVVITIIGLTVFIGLGIFIVKQLLYKPTGEHPTLATVTAITVSTRDNCVTLSRTQHSLRNIYSERFRDIAPISQIFSFDIEKNWIDLTLDLDGESTKTDDYIDILNKGFTKAKMLIIEGTPGTGKTTLLRRIAYGWGNKTEKLSHFDLIVYAEFRGVQRNQTYQNIADLVIDYNKNILENDTLKDLQSLLSNREFSKERKILLLLDGYDELSFDGQCEELTNYLSSETPSKQLVFNIVLTTRPGHLSEYRGIKKRFVFADLSGFSTNQQKEKYILKHFEFTETDKKDLQIAEVRHLLNSNTHLNKLAETPLFLTFICLVHERITDGSPAEALLNLYCSIVSYLLERCQRANRNLNVPELFGYQPPSYNGSWNNDESFHTVIEDNYLYFPQLHALGLMALHNIEKTVFSQFDLNNFGVKQIVEKVGLIRKEKKKRNSFPHRTIQEFLAAFSFFFSKQRVSNETLKSKLYQNNTDVNEFRMFLRLFAETKTIPVNLTRQQEYLEWSKKQFFSNVQTALNDTYLTRFRKTNPFSLPFTFDIENTWVSLALREDIKHSQGTDDYAIFLKRAFEKAKVLIIEGKPGSGKTSLMQRLAYEWANGKKELSHYDLVIYAELRGVREVAFESSADFPLEYLKNFLLSEVLQDLKFLLANKNNYQEHSILLLLDGYDELSSEMLCEELCNYISLSTNQSSRLFNIVLTTRPGNITKFRENEGNFIFAEVLDFNTQQQKEKYIRNHFHSSEIDNERNITAVQNLLNDNENLNKLAETPLFITFICVVHERIDDGTLLELYCNIIRWLIDRHQQDNPDRDVPALFGFLSNYGPDSEHSWQKQNTIRKHYLQFPQLLSLGKMALSNLSKDIFQEADFTEFSIKSIVHEVGLIRKNEFYDQSGNLTTTYSFPHRTIQEFLAAFYYFSSDDPASEFSFTNFKLNTSKMNEFERFLFRIALSDKMPMQAEKRKYYFERIIDINLNIKFDAFNAAAGFNSELLNWFLSQCTNVQYTSLYGEENGARHESRMTNDTSIHNRLVITSKTYRPAGFSFSDVIEFQSLEFNKCAFSANSQLSFTNCPSLKNLKFSGCKFENSAILDIATLPAIDTLEFNDCKFDLKTWHSITDGIRNSSVKFLKLKFGKDFNKEFLIHLRKCNVDKMEITIENYAIRQNDLLSFSDLIKLDSVTFQYCTFEANSQLSFTNCPFLKNLRFYKCKLNNSTNLGITTLPAIDTMQFYECRIDLATWQPITDAISNSSVKFLHLSASYFAKEIDPNFLHHLQKCKRIKQIHINDVYNRHNNHHILKRYEKEVTAYLVEIAQKLLGLKSISILDEFGYRLDESRRLEQGNKERIEKAGRERNPNFSINYVGWDDPELVE